MTLLIAAIEKDLLWMVADTAITGGSIGPRDRVYAPKIESAHDMSLIGFAGDSHYGQLIIRSASLLPAGAPTLEFLLEKHREVGSVDLAYGFIADGVPRLFKIADGSAQNVATLHLGETGAFSQFQTIRHNHAIDHAPRALHQFIFGIRDPDVVSVGMKNATVALLRLIHDNRGHSAGGWAVPYLLSNKGTELCTYAYNVTDPIVGELPPGAEIPHGTVEAGGFSFSFAELRERDGMVAYWLQRPGGLIFIRAEDGYDIHEFDGAPTQFKERAYEKLRRHVDVWFGEQALGTPTSVSFLYDEAGRPRIAVAQDGSALSFAWLQNTEESFRFSRMIKLDHNTSGHELSDPVNPMRLDVFRATDGKTVTIVLSEKDEPLGHIILDALSLEGLITSLANARASLDPAVTMEVSQGTQLVAVVDPAWRTRARPHPAIPGPLLSLRHPGLGWVAFVLPEHEAQSLGQWLAESGQTTPSQSE